MKRVLIQLNPPQWRKATRHAAEKQISFAALIRMSLAEYLKREARRDRAAA